MKASYLVFELYGGNDKERFIAEARRKGFIPLRNVQWGCVPFNPELVFEMKTGANSVGYCAALDHNYLYIIPDKVLGFKGLEGLTRNFVRD